MAKPRFVEQTGVRILVVDYSHARGESLRKRVAENERFIREQPEQSLLILAKVAGIEFSPDATRLMLAHIEGNAPHSRATAVVGLGYLSKAIPIANRLTGRSLQAFDEEAEALDWLASFPQRDEHGLQGESETISFIEHSGERIVRVEFSGLTAPQLMARSVIAGEFIRRQPPRSALILTLARGFPYNRETSSVMKDYVRANRPYVLAAAVVGLDHLSRVILPLNRLTGRGIRAFDNLELAKDWLVYEKRRSLRH